MNIYEKISDYLHEHNYMNIIISGSSCSGKTTLTHSIAEHFSEDYSVAIIAQDDYFKDLADMPRKEKEQQHHHLHHHHESGWFLADSVDAFWNDEFKNDVEKLLKYGFVKTPIYNVAVNKRLSKTKLVNLGSINIFEGLHTISLLNGLKNSIKIFVDTESDICFSRRLKRDTTKYGTPEELVLKYWNECVRPMYDKYVAPQKELADIVLRGVDNEYQTNL